MSLQPDDSRAFLVGQLKPAAQLDRGRDVLLLKSGSIIRSVGSNAVPTEPARPAATSVGQQVPATTSRSRRRRRRLTAPTGASDPESGLHRGADAHEPSRAINGCCR